MVINAKCQKTRRNYGHLTPKKAHFKPLQEVHVDCVGLCTVTQTEPKTGKTSKLSLSCMAITDQGICWFETAPFQRLKHSSEATSTMFCYDWLSHYPRSLSMTHHTVSEFKKDLNHSLETAMILIL